MSEAFLKAVNMSISAGWLVLAVLALRLLLKKAPNWVKVLLWGIVAVRLICPISIESALSLIPSPETISPEIMMNPMPEITTGIPALNSAINPIISDSFAPNPGDSANPLQILIPLAASIWVLGILVLLLYTAVSYASLRRRLRMATILRDNIYQCETVDSPFVLGIVKPRIYLPYGMEDPHVIAHEQAHIRRFDHWWKPLGFLLLTIHWFNPLMWVAYILLCRDIELACDEKVIRELGNEQRADYTQALVACSVNRRMIAACPLAFGEVGVKERVRSIMNYRKPTFWIIVTALVVCVVVAVCFLTDPKPTPEFAMKGGNVSDLDPEGIVERIMEFQDIENSNVYMNSNNFSLTVDGNFDWADSQAIRYFYYENHKVRSAQLRIFPDENEYFLTESDEWPDQNRIFLLRHYLDALKYLPQEAIRELAPADRYLIEHIDGGNPGDYDRGITYSSQGAGEIDGWYLHLRLLPLHDDGEGYSGTGEEAVHLFYGDSAVAGAEMWFELQDWDTEREYTIDEFPGVTFCCSPGQISVGDKVLLSGMPIWCAYLCDLTGDGYPEICTEISLGSGISDNRIIVYDYANGADYTLERRMTFDYHLRRGSDGLLYADKCSYFSGALIHTGRLVLQDGVLQILGDPSANPAITAIDDPTKDPNFACDTAMEKFFEDDANEYFFSGIYSQYVIVHYEDGTSENIVSAMASGRATLSDLDRFDIRYWSEPKADRLDDAISKTILEHYAAEKPDGLLHVESHVLLSSEVMSGTPLAGQTQHAELVTAYLLVHHVKYSTYGGALEAKGGSYVPTAITFRVDDSGAYVLEEYWEPRDGGLYDKDIRSKFPDPAAKAALNDQAYIEELKVRNYNKALAQLDETLMLDQQIGLLLDAVCAAEEGGRACEAELQELTAYGEYTLRYCFTHFLLGGQTDLRGQIMGQVCRNIMLAWGEGYVIEFDPVSGQAWFDEFRANAQHLYQQHSSEELAKHYPGAYLLLQMCRDDYATK